MGGAGANFSSWKIIVLVLGNWVVSWHTKFREGPKDLGLVSKHSFRWNDKGGENLGDENLNGFYSSMGGINIHITRN